MYTLSINIWFYQIKSYSGGKLRCLDQLHMDFTWNFQLPFDRRGLAWTLYWLFFHHIYLYFCSFHMSPSKFLGTYHRFTGVQKCSLHFLRFHSIFLQYRLSVLSPFSLYIDLSDFSGCPFLCFFPAYPWALGPLPASWQSRSWESTTAFYCWLLCVYPPSFSVTIRS